MALTPELTALRDQIKKVEVSKRTDTQNRLLKELDGFDRITVQKSIEEAFSSETRMTSAGGGLCRCCGR